MTVLLSPNAKQKFDTLAGAPASGYKLWTYAAGTTNPQATYSNRAGTSANTNPIILNARGEATVYLTPGLIYDYKLTNASDVLEWTQEGVAAQAGDADSIVFDDALAPTYLKTLSDILNGGDVSVHRFIDPTKLSAIRAGTTTYDASGDVQDGLDAAALTPGGFQLHFPRGTILARNLVVSGNTTLDGQGPSSVLKLLSGALITDKLLGNANPGAYTDNNITLRGITFDGNNAGSGGTQTRFTELLSFGRVTNLAASGIIVSNVQYIGLAVAGSRRVKVMGSQFAGCGYNGTTANGGSSCWISNMGTDQCEDVLFTGNHVHDNLWHGLHFSVVRGIVGNNVFQDNTEAHLFGSRALGLNIDMSDISITGNMFDRVRMRDISAHAIEIGGIRMTIAGNTIRDCDHGGIALTDSSHASITGNTIGNFNNLAYTLGGGIDIICSAASPDQSKHITITGNTIYDDRATVLGKAGVYVHAAGGVAPTDLSITDNNLNAAWTSGRAVEFGAGMLSTTATVKNNRGNDDTARGCTVSQAVAQSIPNATDTVLVFGVAAINSVDMVASGTAMWVAGSPSRITIKESCRVQISGQVGFAGNATGIRQCVLLRNGTGAMGGPGRTVVPNATAAFTQHVGFTSGVIDAVAGDYFEVSVYQDSGGALSTAGNILHTWFSVTVL